MKPERSQKADFLPLTGPDPTDASPIMQEKAPRRFEDPREALEALLQWDELEREELAALEQHPQHAERLQQLRAVQGWMDQRLSTPRPGIGPCPSPEELYDYGRGVGANPLSAERRAELEPHVHRCTACEHAIEVLATRPPAVVISPREASLPLSAPLRALPPRPSPIEELDEGSAMRHDAPAPRNLWRPALALAAGLLGGLALWTLVADEGTPRLPQTPQLRGSQSGALLFPRGLLLADREALGAVALPLRIELAPLQSGDAVRAERWRVELLRHAGGAFDAGLRVAEYQSSQPEILIEDALGVGHYTARAYATVAGLERECGAQDFEVRHDPQLLAELEGTQAGNELDRTRLKIRLLHERGYLTDARELARTLPPDEDRNRYLSSDGLGPARGR